MRKLLIIGPVPPPYGGVAIHLERLRTLLVDAGISFHILSPVVAHTARGLSRLSSSRFKHFQVAYKAFPRGLVHAHFTKPEELGLLRKLQFLGLPTMLSLHSMGVPDALAASAAPRDSELFRTLLALRRLVCMNAETRDALLTLGYPGDKLVHLPAFLPPVVCPEDREQLPAAVRKALVGGGPLLSMNAFSFDLYGGELLYGIDLALELCQRLAGDFSGLRLVYIQSVSKGAVDEAWVRRQIHERGLEGRFIFHLGGCNFAPVLAASDLFLRPTNTDGDALSIREAIHLNVPVLASNCVIRPEGTRLFRNRDIDDLERVTREMLSSLVEARNSLKRLSKPSFGHELVQILKEELAD
jgi:glycosyltransferase involved in cell wall biosynthesis